MRSNKMIENHLTLSALVIGKLIFIGIFWLVCMC